MADVPVWHFSDAAWAAAGARAWAAAAAAAARALTAAEEVAAAQRAIHRVSVSRGRILGPSDASDVSPPPPTQEPPLQRP